MSLSTKFSSLLPWFISAVLAAPFIVVIHYLPLKWLNIYPVTMAEIVSTLSAIDQFETGVSSMQPYWNQKIAALLGIVLFFVAGPALWIISEARQKGRKPMTWYAGTTLVLAGLFVFGTGLVKTISGYQQEKTLIESAQNREQLRAELVTISYNSIENYILANEKPESANSVETIQLENLTISLNSKNSFVLAPLQPDSVLIIYGVGTETGSNPNFQNINGETGRVQAAIKVKLAAESIDRFRADSVFN